MKEKLERILKSDSARNSMWIISERIIQMIISFIITMISARYLGPTNYGVLNYGVSFVTFFSAIVKLGIDSIIVKEFIDKPKREGELLGTSIVFRLISSGISILLIFICVTILKYDDKLIIITTVLQSISLLFQAINVFDYWFQSKLKSKYVSISKVIAYSTAGIYKIYLLMNNYSVKWFALSTTIDYVLICILLYVFYKKNKGQKLGFDIKLGVELIKNSYHFIISGLMIIIYTQIDKIMIGTMLNAELVGFYSAAVVIHSAFEFLPEAIVTSLRPSLFKLKKDNQKLYIRRLKQTFSIVFWLCFGFAVLTMIFSKLIIQFTYGSQYLNATIPLSILVLAVPFSYLGTVRSIWTIGEGLQRYIKRYMAIGAILNIILNFILIPIYGIIGAAIATLITEVFIGIVAPLLYKDTRIVSKLILESIFLKFN